MSEGQDGLGSSDRRSDRSNSRRGGGPRLDRDEWIVLLDIHLTNREGATEQRARSIDLAVEVLSKIASRRGRARLDARLRSHHGLHRRLTELRALDRGNAINTPREALEVWLRYRHDPEGCAEAAATIIRRERVDHVVAVDGHEAMPRSHGPVPSFGSFDSVRDDGCTQIYLMELVAQPPFAAMARTQRGPIFKIGRTNEPVRRRLELNQGFPPGIGLEWRLVGTLECPDARVAHAVEQAALDRCEAGGHCIGREFVSLSLAKATQIMAEISASFGVGGLPHSAETRSASRSR
jgi:hypothetical protein